MGGSTSRAVIAQLIIAVSEMVMVDGDGMRQKE